MTWSTSQLAELAGTTVKAIRHYHEIGLLDHPERASNGYKRYTTRHLVRVLRIRRLVDLGVPLARIPAEGAAEQNPGEALRIIDAELAASIDRLQKVRAELALILQHDAPVDLPPGFSAVAGELSDTDRALVLIYSQVINHDAMDSLRELIARQPRSPGDDVFDALPEDADEAARQALAEQLAEELLATGGGIDWVDADTQSLHSAARTQAVIGSSMAELYNRAQLDVLVRVHALAQQRSD